ncbi:ATPase assembly factor ATP10 [Phakopsora pachyrhizi]|uniref:ATPase assembly factor ATP10 n=1 Tax=Phakopsora pachyrhizi TaxID=170000 RepID=A0AAV0ALZ2_PHAPC|nr:ATPase assembly factor ATP10 [Phakopsora pachyrhizi]CAH7668057.1 ATPase assembly factor ATP10 [Phakopsora pachyrhizi]
MLRRKPQSPWPCYLKIRSSPRLYFSSKPEPLVSTDSSPVENELNSEKSDSSSNSSTKDLKLPPYIPRPLGVSKPPSTDPLTKEEKLAKLVNEDARLEERKHLISEVSRGYYHDWNALRHNGNKLWTAPPSLIQEQCALYFPNISGIALSNKRTVHTTDLFAEKVSLLAVETTQMSEEHTRSYYQELTRMMAGEKNLQLVRLNIQENPLKSWLVSLFLNNLRKSVPAHQHSKYLISNQNLEYIREPLGMVNQLLGYVYLVDWNRKVRWAGCGFATAAEMRGLFGGTRALLKRYLEK